MRGILLGMDNSSRGIPTKLRHIMGKLKQVPASIMATHIPSRQRINDSHSLTRHQVHTYQELPSRHHPHPPRQYSFQTSKTYHSPHQLHHPSREHHEGLRSANPA